MHTPCQMARTRTNRPVWLLHSDRSSFGIVVGRTVDFEAIRNNDLRAGAPVRRSVSVIESDLRANLVGFRDLINEIGFAKSYADGRTVVTTDESAA